MGGFLYALLMMSVSGSIMYIAGEALYSRTGKKSASWYYAMLVTAVLLFIVPCGAMFSIPKLFTVTIPQAGGFVPVEGMPAGEVQGAPFTVKPADIAAIIYIAGATVSFAKLIYEYFHMRSRLLNASAPSFDPKLDAICRRISADAGIRRSVQVRTSPCIKSPLLFGILFPSVIIPEKDFSERDLSLIFRHELTHVKHMDLPIKLCSSVVCALHWFNPLARKLRAAINTACELCCDESVLKDADKAYRKKYGLLLLSVVERSGKALISHTTAMATTHESVVHRLTKIIEFKRLSLPARIGAVMSAMAIAVCSVTAFGFETAAEVLPDKVKEAVSDSGRNDEKTPEGGLFGLIAEIPQSAETPPAPGTAAPSAVPSPAAAPEITPTEPPAEIMAQAEELSRAAEDMVIEESGVWEGAEENSGESSALEYVFTESNTAAGVTAAPTSEPRIPSLPDESYVFYYDFADTGLAAMENRFTASEDCIVCIRRGYSGYGNFVTADVAVYDVTDDGRLIVDTSQIELYSDYDVHVILKAGHEYALRVFGCDENTNVYIYEYTSAIKHLYEHGSIFE